jgi:uncharacterized protein (TIGR03083 family)
VTDYEAAYRDLRERVDGLLRDRPSASVEQIAPATPEWRVRDVVAHLGGVCDDISHGNMAGVPTNAWTAAQVDKRRDQEFGAVLDDWHEHAGTVEPMMNEIGPPMGQMVFDAWTHEQDIRGALGEPGGRESGAAEVAFLWFVDAASPTGVGDGALELVVEDGTYLLGPGEPVRSLRTTRFEFLRAATGRRSRAQVEALDCDGPPLDDALYVADIFTAAPRDIVE